MATFTGTAGVDTFIGADNVADLFRFDPAALAGTDTVAGGAGSVVDELRFTAAGTLAASVFANVGGIETVTLRTGLNSFTIPDALAASADGATLTVQGGDGSDAIDGSQLTAAHRMIVRTGTGIAAILGGAGDDWYFINNAADTVAEGAGQGALDRVFASVSYTLGAGVAIEMFSTDDHAGTAAINLTGNELANAIYGNAGNNTLNGGGGGDSLDGFGGIDTLNGGQGDDQLYAGTGASSLNGDEGNDVLYGIAGSPAVMSGGIGDDLYFVANAGDVASEAAGEGASDWVLAHVSYTLGAGAEIDKFSTDDHAGTTAIDLTGNELANAIYGNAGNNILNGGGGSDSLDGLGGIDTLNGGPGDDQLYAGTGTSTLNGDQGNDVLYGLAGAPATMNGGLGDDWYFIANAGDVVNEAAGQGTLDRAFAHGSYTLTPGASVEMLSTDDTAGTAAINLTGNELANTILGNAGDNHLEGGAGVDKLYGLDGNDTLHGGLGDDTLDGGPGYDTVDYSDATSRLLVFLVGPTPQTTNGGVGNDTLNSIEKVIGGDIGGDVFAAPGTTFVGGGGSDAFVTTSNVGGGYTFIGGDGDDTADIEYAVALTGSTLVGGDGTDWIKLGGTPEVITAGDLAGVRGFEGITQQGGGLVDITLDDAMVSSAANHTLTIAASSGGLVVDASALTGDNVIIVTSGGHTTAIGGAGADQLSGSGQADGFTGGGGADSLTGRSGNDIFAFRNPTEGGDTITDFASTADTLQFDAAAFGFTPGHALADGVDFVSAASPAPVLAQATFLMNTSAHQVLWDADGTGSTAAVLIATLSNNANAAAGDFLLV